MKTPLHHLLTIAAALSASIATAQETPGAPPPGGNPPREAQPPREQRPDRPPLGPDGAGRRDGDRRRDGERQQRPDDFGPPEGRDFPGGRGDRPMPEERFKRGFAPSPAKPQPYLGVATNPLDSALSAQLGFTPGLGIIVEDVIPDSPAAKAGVQTHDVIKQLNDQLISNPGHLAALTRHFGKDTDVTLVVLRKGQEQKITVKIGERMMREPAAVRTEFFGGMRMPGMDRQPIDRRGDNPRPPRDPRDDQGDRPQKNSAELFREVGPGGAPEVQAFQSRGSTTWNTASAKVSLKEANGEIEVRSDNGKRTLIAKSPKGEIVFEGPIDTEEQRKGIPADFRKMLEQVEVRARADRRPGGSGAEAFGRVNREDEGPRPQRGERDIQ